MIHIDVRLHYVFSSFIGLDCAYIDRSYDLPEGTTVEMLYKEMSKEFGDVFIKSLYNEDFTGINLNFTLIINRCMLDVDTALQTELHDGDLFMIVPLYQGG